MKRAVACFQLFLICAICFPTSVRAADSVSSEQAIRIAIRFMQQHRQKVRSLRVHAWPRWGDFEDEYDREIRKRLNHRTYWFVLFTPRDPDVYGGVHKIYIATDSGEILGWGGER
jgi:hypothetical protein